MSKTDLPKNLPAVVPVTTQIKQIVNRVNLVRIGVDIEQKDLSEYVETLKLSRDRLFNLLSTKGITASEEQTAQALAQQFHLLYRANKTELEHQKPKKSYWKLGFAVATAGLSLLVWGV